jgi:acetolactate synthase-1/2/3 large subunit
LDVQDAMGENDWLVIDGGNTHFWSEIAINIAGAKGKKLKGILHPGTFSMLGVGVSFALSAKNHNPDSNVVLISGDGAFLSGGMSIESVFYEKKPITVVIDNNGGLASIGQQQERLFKSGKSVGTDFRDIPFHKIFEGFGGHGELVNKREELGPALKRAMESGKPACVNVKAKPVLSPIVSAVASKREKSSIE